MKYLLVFGFILHFIFFNSQTTIDSIAHVNYNLLHETMLNDVWGHVDASGVEYAIVGTRKGTSIVSLQNPTAPQEVFWESGTESIWRDVNTFQNYAYVTTEADDGLLIINMNSLPNASGITTNYYNGPTGNEWSRAHTLFVDSAGYAYIFGANRGNGGVIILDVHTDPMNPIEVGTFDEWYCHDGYVVGDTMYLAHIYDGFISMVDITDRSNPILLGTKFTTNNFAHNIWTSYDKQYAFTTDEVAGAYVGSYDISDPSNIQLLDLVQSSPGKGVIPHNVQYMNEFLIVSYYSDGVVVFDAKQPDNLLQVGSYDTYPSQTTTFDGCWSSYPFLPSGLILAADISEGLFILQPNYQHAAYLRGNIINQSTLENIQNVSIQITNSDHSELSKSNGNYATGVMQTGNYEVTFSKVGFYPQSHTVSLTQGLETVLDVILVPIPQFPLKVIVKDAITNQAILNAQVDLTGSLTTNLLATNGLGEAIFMLYYQESYILSAGKWGYKTSCTSQSIDNTTNQLTVYLSKGYYDDFTFDFAWTTLTNGATKGLWERGIPNTTSTNSAPGVDANFDCGTKAFVTGNDPNLSPTHDDIQDGEVVLRSPNFDLTSYSTPYIHFSTWFYNFHGPNPPDDTLKIYLSNGFTTVLVDYETSDPSSFFSWQDKVVRVQDFILPTANMTLSIKVSDLNPNVNVTEAGFDFFYVENESHLGFIETESYFNIIFIQIPLLKNLHFQIRMKTTIGY
jgi:choice-of-anchor B domain-containing protein